MPPTAIGPALAGFERPTVRYAAGLRVGSAVGSAVAVGIAGFVGMAHPAVAVTVQEGDDRQWVEARWRRG